MYMALTSSSTLAQVQAEYLDNCDWEGDVTKATACLQAIRHMLIRRPVRSAVNGRDTELESLQDEKKKLEAFIELNKTSVKTQRSGFTQGRMLR